jgi:hypothetical protein
LQIGSPGLVVTNGFRARFRRATFAHVAPTWSTANNMANSLASHAHRHCRPDLANCSDSCHRSRSPLETERAVSEDGRMKKLAFVLALLPTLAPAQSPAYHDPGMKVVTQVAIVCRDIEATSRRWASVLGVAPPRILTIKPGNEAKLVYRGHPSNGQAKLAIPESRADHRFSFA